MSNPFTGAPWPGATEESYPKLISLAVHELRTPASVVGGYLRMLQRDVDPPMSERQQKMVEEAAKSCARLVELIAELSDVSKLDAGIASVMSEPVDVFALVGDVAAGVHEAEDRGVRLDVRGPADGAHMRGDPTRLRAAIHAILRAILREQPSACTVVADRRRGSDDGREAAVIVVADESTVQRAYETPRGAFDEKRGGMGLALPIARRVIEAHGGRLWAPAASSGDAPALHAAAIVSLPLEMSR